MNRRIASNAVLGVIALVCALAGKSVLLALVLVLAIATGGELYRLARVQGHRPAALVGLASIAAMIVVGYVHRESAFPAVVAASLALTFAAMLVRRRRTGVTRAIFITLLPVLVVGLLAAYILVLRNKEHGLRLVVALGLLAIAADIGASIVASRGPQPNARAWWRRLFGALGGAVVAALFVAMLVSTPVTLPRALVLAVIVAPAITITGAITEMIEDDLGRVRMFGRVDAVLFAAPVFFYAYGVLWA